MKRYRASAMGVQQISPSGGQKIVSKEMKKNYI